MDAQAVCDHNDLPQKLHLEGQISVKRMHSAESEKPISERQPKAGKK